MEVRQRDHKILRLRPRNVEKSTHYYGRRSHRDEGERKLFALLVEDAVENQFLMSRILAARGIDVEIACNGQEAVEKAMDACHDLVLMDMQMPIMDGYDATRILRELGYAKPIIALTAQTLPEEHLRIMASGCDAHLTKPINFMILLKTIVEYTAADLEVEADCKVEVGTFERQQS